MLNKQHNTMTTNNNHRTATALLLAGTILLLAAACSAHNSTNTGHNTPPTDSIPLAKDAPQSYSVTGTVTAITPGKDGYMATIKGDNDTTYSTTLSIMRLGHNFQRIKIGEHIQVSGDTIHLGPTINVLAKELSKP